MIMCSNIKILNTTPNGYIYWFRNSDLIQVIFKNLCFDFSRHTYNSFLDFITHMDADQIDKQYEKSMYKRKIPIPVCNTDMTIILNKEELLELQFLLNNKIGYNILSNPEEKIEYQMILN